MLASDLNNPEFAGASDPDSRLHVVFMIKPVKNEFKTQIEGRPIFEDVPFVRIMVPGDALSIIEAPVREDHKQRFPRHWAHFQNTQGKDNLEVGTPLTQWPQLSPSQVEELKALKFVSVDAIANASDQAIGRIGMAGGMQPHTLRDRARRFLLVASDTSTVDRAKEEADRLRKEIRERDEEHAAEREANARKFEELQAQLAALTKTPAKRGPKPKVKQTVE